MNETLKRPSGDWRRAPSPAGAPSQDNTFTERLLVAYAELQERVLEVERQNRQLRGELGRRDATEMLRAESYSAAPVGLLALDAAGVVIDANAAAARLAGVSMTQMRGATLLRRLLPGDRATFEAHLARLRRSKRTQSCEVSMMRADGVALQVCLISTVSMADDDSGYRCHTAIVDLSPLRLAEQSLREMARRAEEADRAKTRLLSAASHDLRQWLQSIGIRMELVRRRARDQEIVTMTGALCEQMEAAGELLDAYLDLSRLETGAIKPRIRRFRADKLLRQLTNQFQPVAENKGLVWRVVPSRLLLKSDRALLVRVLENVAANACEYTGRGKILIGCRRDGDSARIEVHDTGPGIPGKLREAVFEDFLRDEPRRASHGLGLAIVGRIARLLAHSVSMRPRPSGGTVFSITVPMAGASAQSRVSQPARARAGPAPAKQSRLGTGTILLVEDDPASREATRELLALVGYGATAFSSKKSALKWCEGIEQAPALIVSDYLLPDNATGLDVIQEVRDLFGEAVPAILVTGLTDPEIATQAHGRVCTLLRKPLSAHHLLAQVESFMAKPGTTGTGVDESFD